MQGPTTVLAALTLALAGCVAPQPVHVVARPPDPDPRLVARATQSAADQARRCYAGPRLSRDARQIVTRLRVRLLPDGRLAEPPALIEQFGLTPANRVHAPVMAQAAIGAVLRCVPYTLPVDLYHRGWETFELTFSPRAAA